MKILVLTPISPAHSGVAYSRIANHFQKNKKVDTLSISVFADIQARMENKEFLPNFFAMLQGSEIQKTKYRLYLNHYTIMVGNIYKSHKFDYIISLGHDNEEIFDLYLEELRTNPEADEFNTKARIEDLYSPEDAELNVPTIDHAIKFIEEVIKNDELNRQQFRDNAKRKTKKGS